jgi:apolipoprotein D and lipocalin family protein
MTDSTARLSATLLVLSALAGCASSSLNSVPRGLSEDGMPLDLSRFMGDWYVLAHIPTRAERNAYDALEQYTLRDDGRIDIRFSFCEGATDGPLERLEMLGWVHDTETNAEWRVRPFWPLRLGYQVLELTPDYSLTVIGHPSRRYAWVMARTPEIDADTLNGIVERLTGHGFDTGRLRLVPHSDRDCRTVAR